MGTNRGVAMPRNRCRFGIAQPVTASASGDGLYSSVSVAAPSSTFFFFRALNPL